MEIALVRDRFVVKTQGTGLADRPRVVDIGVGDLRQFCLTPTTVAQNSSGTRYNRVVDASRDAELIFSYTAGGGVKKRRVFVASGDPSLQAILHALRTERPDASLLHLAPRDAYRAIGVLSPQQGMLIVLLVIVGLPILGVLVWALVRALS